jgi:hypothetical protein
LSWAFGVEAWANCVPWRANIYQLISASLPRDES